jgi:hypothetical protein
MLDGNFLHLIYHANSSYATLLLYRWRKPASESTWLILAGGFFFISDRTQVLRVQLRTEMENLYQKPKGEKGNSHREKREQLECLTSFSNRHMTISAEEGSFWKEKPPTSTCYVCFLTCRIFLRNICLYELFYLLTFHTAHGYPSIYCEEFTTFILRLEINFFVLVLTR